MVTLSKPTAQRADVTIWLQALDGTWEACGTNRMIGVVPESLVCESDHWGSKTASFDLRRPVSALWPDIAAFAPCMIEIGGVLRWRGRTNDTPIRDGVDPVINVECEGSQVRLDDDVYQRAYVHSTLSDYKDMRSVLTASLGADKLCAAGQVTTVDGGIVLSLPSGHGAVVGTTVGVVLDLGPNCTAAAMSIDYETSAGPVVTSHAFYVRAGRGQDVFDGGTDAWVDYPYSLGAAGTISNNFPTPSRYVQLFITFNAPYTLPADLWIKLKRVQIFTDTSYRSGSASALTASTVVKDALDRATMLLSPDRTGIQATSFAIPDLAPSEERTPREMMEGVNAFHNWILKLDENDRPIFRPRPTAPLIEIGSWQGAELVDASANSGAEIYNRCICRAEGSDGTPVVVQRTAGQQPSAIPLPIDSPAPVNPSFATNTSGWSAVSGTITRDTVTYHSSPASGKVDGDISASFTGTFQVGVPYLLTLWIARQTDFESISLYWGNYPADVGFSYAPEGRARSWVQASVSWTPLATTSSVTLRIYGHAWVDDLQVSAARPTVVDRRAFRRTFVLKPSFKITEAVGQQLTDTYLAAHRTTPYKGSCRIMPGGARSVLGGSSPHPSALLTMTQELLGLSHRVDPDTGGVGRTATIASVRYTHRDQASTVDLDDPRGNLDAFMARMAVVQGAGS